MSGKDFLNANRNVCVVNCMMCVQRLVMFSYPHETMLSFHLWSITCFFCNFSVSSVGSSVCPDPSMLVSPGIHFSFKTDQLLPSHHFPHDSCYHVYISVTPKFWPFYQKDCHSSIPLVTLGKFPNYSDPHNALVGIKQFTTCKLPGRVPNTW